MVGEVARRTLPATHYRRWQSKMSSDRKMKKINSLRFGSIYEGNWWGTTSIIKMIVEIIWKPPSKMPVRKSISKSEEREVSQAIALKAIMRLRRTSSWSSNTSTTDSPSFGLSTETEQLGMRCKKEKSKASSLEGIEQEHTQSAVLDMMKEEFGFWIIGFRMTEKGRNPDFISLLLPWENSGQW